jgi:hypothetical protein
VVKNVKLLRRVERCLVNAIFRWQRQRAKEVGVLGKPKGGVGSFTQMFSSALAMAPHLRPSLLQVQSHRKRAHSSVASQEDETPDQPGPEESEKPNEVGDVAEWAQQGLNLRPLPCEFGPGGWHVSAGVI